ncbi:hypothetical protein SISSUDRAFT_959032, partial [Sistotremastrum suecicum HHB10207 ss-3]
LLFNLSDSEIIMEIMNGAPAHWTSILTPHLCRDVVTFQASIKYHEDSLMQMQKSRFVRNKPSGSRIEIETNAKAHPVGFSPGLEKPQFPRDDKTVSKGKTPEDLGARACRHCGSPKHWDNDCKHARRGGRNMRVNAALADVDYEAAQEEYDNLYY